jgi:type II secretory pathway pseudopilin PulG
MYKLKTPTQHKKAFTLVETLVAISVLLLAVVAPLTMVSDSIATANVAKDQVTAQYLAQEGVEMVRLIRDSNILNGSTWLSSSLNTGFSNCVAKSYNNEQEKFCYINQKNILSNPATACTNPLDSSTCPALNIFDSTGEGGIREYGYDTAAGNANWGQTTFVRSISVVEQVADQEAEVSSIVTWKTGNYSHTVSAREKIFKWN